MQNIKVSLMNMMMLYLIKLIYFSTACTLGPQLCGLIQELLKLAGPKKENIKMLAHSYNVACSCLKSFKHEQAVLNSLGLKQRRRFSLGCAS